SAEESEKFKKNIMDILERTGFIKGKKYWENKEIGRLRLYTTNENNEEGKGILCLSIKSPSAINGIPPVVNIIEQTIYSQRWTSLKVERDPKYT
ncbi:MAG: hypothetical protein U1B79_01300, partial [Candidatus Pacearchaeota archaeon]|nr:hypothetical protein [Candidatus Pacearchaeota archaeon]